MKQTTRTPDGLGSERQSVESAQWIAPWQRRGHAVEQCDASSGHSVRAVAFCDTYERAEFIKTAVNSYDALVEALRDARIELGRLHSLHLDRYQGKIGEPDVAVIVKADAALMLAEGEGA